MEPFTSFITWLATFLGEHLYEGIFLAALLETIIPPIPTLALFPSAGFLASQNNIPILGVIPMIVLGGAGATVGSFVIYLIALKLGRAVLLRYLGKFRFSHERLARVETWFEKHGDKTVFFGRLVPVMREMVSIPAGLLGMKMPKFILYTFAGSCVWAAITILSGYYFGQVLDLDI